MGSHLTNAAKLSNDWGPALPVIPLTIFECTLKHIEIHEVDSIRPAFRLAGRYAAEAFLENEEAVVI